MTAPDSPLQGAPTTAEERSTQAFQAAVIIGQDAPDDYVLSPTAHAARYFENAPALSAILSSSGTRVAAEEFERCDGTASEGQRAFKGAANQANLAVLVTASLGAAIMLLGLLDAPSAVLLAVGIGGAVVGAYGAFLTQQIKQRRLLERWMTARADAETYRYDYFALVTAPPPREVEGLALLQLEYFRRYQLDVQTHYYDRRQRDHERRSDRTATFVALAGFLGALSTGVAGFLSAGEGAEWAGIAALGILGMSLASYAAGRDAIGQDARNAERYGRTRAALRHLSARLDDVRQAVAAGNRSAMDEFVAAVQEQLSVEHRQWRSESESTRAGLARLEEAITTGTRPRTASGPGGGTARPE